MKKICIILLALTTFIGCNKDDDEAPLMPKPKFSIIIPDTIQLTDRWQEIPISIKSDISNINIRLSAISYIDDYGYFGSRMSNTTGAYGFQEDIYLTSKDTTIILENINASRYRGKLTFPVYFHIFHESMKEHEDYYLNNRDEYGELLANSVVAQLWEPPLFNSINMDVKNLTSDSCQIIVKELNANVNVYTSSIEHGLCISKSEFPDISDIVIKPYNTYIRENWIYSVDSKIQIEEDSYYATKFSLRLLEPETTYYVRFYLSNGKIGYSEQLTFTTPSKGGVPDYNYEYKEINKKYLADDGLTIKVNSIVKSFIENSKTSYKINYTVTNNSDKEVLENNFTLYSLTGDEKIRQTGFFDKLFPGDSRTRTFTFDALYSKNYHILEYNSDFFENGPNKNKLMWELE